MKNVCISSCCWLLFCYYFKSDHHGLNRIGWIYIYHNRCNLWLSMLKLWVWFPSVAKPYGYQTLEYEFCTCTRRKQPIRMLHRTDAMFWLADYWLILEKKKIWHLWRKVWYVQTTLCDRVVQWHSIGQWFSLVSLPIKLTPYYNITIVLSGVMLRLKPWTTFLAL